MFCAEANVELVVAGGAVAAVVPLLSHFPVSEHDSSSRFACLCYAMNGAIRSSSCIA